MTQEARRSWFQSQVSSPLQSQEWTLASVVLGLGWRAPRRHCVGLWAQAGCRLHGWEGSPSPWLLCDSYKQAPGRISNLEELRATRSLCRTVMDVCSGREEGKGCEWAQCGEGRRP